VVTAVTLIRPRHPLEGRSLEVLGRMRRHGAVELLVVLPDGSKRLIPASWTDLDRATGDRGGTPEPGTLGSLADLLHACAVAADLDARAAGRWEQAARQSPSKEADRAAHPAQSDARPATPATRGPGRAAPRRAGGGGGGLLARLIAKAADPSAAQAGKQVGGDE
jgi:hypothetical protein